MERNNSDEATRHPLKDFTNIVLQTPEQMSIKSSVGEDIERLKNEELQEIKISFATVDKEYLDISVSTPGKEHICKTDFQTADFEFLSKIGDNFSSDSQLRRESLYIKFDPLVGQAMTEEPQKSFSSVSTSEESVLTEDTVIENENGGVLIPVTPLNKEQTLNKSNLNTSLTGNRSQVESTTSSPRHEYLLSDKMDEVEELRKKVAELSTREPKHYLEENVKAKDMEIARLKNELNEIVVNNNQLVAVMDEYGKTITQLLRNNEETKTQYEKVKKEIVQERDTAVAHLNNMEIAFNDIHNKYERLKGVAEALYNNEKLLKESLDENGKTIERQKLNYEKLKQHAKEKLQAANQEIIMLGKTQEAKSAKMNALLMKAELKTKSSEEALEQRNKEIRELTRICDELISRVTSK